MSHPPTTRRTGLNRTVLLRPDAPWHGRRAGRVLGASGLSARVARAAPDPTMTHPTALLLALDRALSQAQPWAEEVAAEWVDAAAELLRTLRSPTAADRACRTEWDEPDWARWAAVDRIVLGGGVVAGSLGTRAAQDHRLVEHGAELAPDPARGPLLGLASGPPPVGPCLLLDLGHSSVKAAVLARGGVGPTVAVRVPWQPFDTTTWPGSRTVLDLVVRAAGEALLGVDGTAVPGRDGTTTTDDGPVEVRVAIANYVVDGVLDDDQTYGTLNRPGADPSAVLAEALTTGLGLPCTVSMLVNDGAAAALGVTGAAGRRGTVAVISIGTSLGLGFADA
ncbi:ROK family protein [Serinicoccus kebangsaanensis]|uniref:ROK family protein n=1 Tax=Serinicoccus kebangsaanensis TaxID=2602069 RepID=UPI00124C2D6D|nr:ROK family protein [Serinicoccus kebangsaanensis]